MNIVIIMSGGVGARFGAVIPKQYNLIAGRPVIDYVIDAVLESRLTDKVVVVMDPQWRNYSENLKSTEFDFALNGATRIESLYNGLKQIKDNYACDKVLIVDAVAPFLYGELIDEYFDRLDEYDAVITAQKITGGFTDVYNSRLDREQYIITQSPEGFRFELLWNNFQIDYPYQEMAGMLPDESTRYYNYEFKNNLKLTYDFELAYAEYVLRNLGRLNRKSNVAYFDKEVLLTEGIKTYLLRREPQNTMKWIDEVYTLMPKMISKWEITSFVPNQVSRYGLVLQADSSKYGSVIIKFIPEFVERFEREVEAYRYLSPSYMCPVLEVDEENRVMLLQEIKPAKYASFEENLKLTQLFEWVIQEAVEYTGEQELKYIPDYYVELKMKLDAISAVPYCKEEVKAQLQYAVHLYEEVFLQGKKYIVHGDLHELNLLDNGHRLWAIDPNGMCAPLELECVRFIRNDVRNHPTFGYSQRFHMLLQYFGRYVDEVRLAQMFIIDMAFCTYNSTFENELPDKTHLDLELIQIAKKWLEDTYDRTSERKD